MVRRGHGSCPATADARSSNDCVTEVPSPKQHSGNQEASPPTAECLDDSFKVRRVQSTKDQRVSPGASSPDNQSSEQANMEECPDSGSQIRRVLSPAGKTIEQPIIFKQVLYGKNDDREWTFDEISFQSALDQPNTSGRKRLVFQAAHRNDVELWAQLLAHRRRIFGIEGVRVIWDQMRNLKVKIPLEGRLGHDFWNSFIDLGLRTRKVLDQIIDYANEDRRGSRGLPTVYVRTIQHFTLQGNESEVRHWHERLISKHPPSAERFRRMVRTIVYSKGDLDILRFLYLENQHRNLYSSIVPLLCAQLEFIEALKWHTLMMNHSDLPREQKAVEALQSFLERYKPNRALEFHNSLKDAGVDFRAAQSAATSALSQEMMNPIHGQTFDIEKKQYNDKIGARWFATMWISLDLAITSVHALGFREIGPLSLHEIAFREPTASQITQRILQLKSLGISIGNSKYSRALENFARKEKHSLLKSLLASDQHPDALEDWKLQQALLGRYASTGDWVQYARTVAIRLVGGPQTKTEEYNTILRDHVTRSYNTRTHMNLKAILGVLDEIQMRALPVKPGTLRYLFGTLLRPRRRGQRPIWMTRNPKDFETALSILRQLLRSGSWVPPSIWIEIMKRLGMAGKFSQLEELCLNLADWYHPQSASRANEVFAHCRHSTDLQKFVVPPSIESSHREHPFSKLFPPALQLAIVAWGFHSSFISTKPYSTATHTPGRHPCTQGIRLLCLLRQRGVSIYRKAVRAEVINRLVAYYGPGESNRIRNRSARKHNPFAFHELITEIQAAWHFGDELKSVEIKNPGAYMNHKKSLFFPSELQDLEHRIHRLSCVRMERVQRKGLRFRGEMWERSQQKKSLRWDGAGRSQII